MVYHPAFSSATISRRCHIIISQYPYTTVRGHWLDKISTRAVRFLTAFFNNSIELREKVTEGYRDQCTPIKEQLHWTAHDNGIDTFMWQEGYQGNIEHKALNVQAFIGYCAVLLP